MSFVFLRISTANWALETYTVTSWKDMNTYNRKHHALHLIQLILIRFSLNWILMRFIEQTNSTFRKNQLKFQVILDDYYVNMCITYNFIDKSSYPWANRL